ncbi:MFS transporter [Orrella daihaiensis]|uniref:MFS transporter n=1 Tax=Orrella daihaiensis TaxID=2782176 RepID=A0ABY4AKP3_9BURK|nr:MFS transporter [Orrella daihaiensis]UOD50865.1 MFS transporter [Orrella daihaiensis]
MLAPLLGLGQICAWGSLYYSFPLIVLRMEAELGWSKSELYAGATIGLAMTALLSYPVGVGIDRGHGKWIMAGASFAAMIVMAWWSITDSLLAFYFICALSGAIQAAVLYEPAFAVFARHVGARNARAGITHITLWGGFASTVFIPVTELLINAVDWRNTLLWLGAVNFIYGLLYLWLIRPQTDLDHAHTGEQKLADISRDRQIVRENLGSSLFWLILGSLTIYAGMFSAFTFHMYPLLQEDGLSERDVVLAIAIIGPAQVLGRYLVTIYAPGVPLRWLGSVMVAVFPVAFALLIQANPGFWLVAVVFAAYGMANGIFTIVRSFVVPEMLSPHAYGALNGIITIAATAARAAAPLAAAWLWTVNQSYGLVMWAIVGASLLLAAGFWTAAWRTR